jgi:hypothetical protein
MSTEIQQHQENKFITYSNHELITDLHTNTALLSQEQKDTVTFAVNKAWINPKFKMKYFQAEEQLTPFHKLRQLMLELRAQEESIEQVEYVVEKLSTECEIVEIKISRATDELEQKEWQLKLVELKKDLSSAKRRVTHQYIERHMYLDLIKEHNDDPENRTVDGQSLMTVFNTPLEDEYEKQYWVVRFAKQAAMDLLSYGNISAGNLSSIVVLPPELQDEIFKIAHHYTAEMKAHQEEIREQMIKQIDAEKKMINMPPEVKKDQNTKIKKITPEDGDLENVYNL